MTTVDSITVTVRVRCRYRVAGGHVHVRVFATTGTGDTMGLCGALTFTTEEWAQIHPRVVGEGIECLEDNA